MRPIDPVITKRHQIVRLFAILFLVITPVLYVVVGYAATSGTDVYKSGQHDLLFYIFLIIAAVVPLFTPLLERIQLRQIRMRDKSVEQVAAVYQTTFILRASMVESAYLLGLAVVFISQGDYIRMVPFYAIGIFYSFLNWPTEARLRTFLERVGRYDRQ